MYINIPEPSTTSADDTCISVYCNTSEDELIIYQLTFGKKNHRLFRQYEDTVVQHTLTHSQDPVTTAAEAQHLTLSSLEYIYLPAFTHYCKRKSDS